nr:V-type ATP synthase subunit D [Maliibacterium massiliense]
MAATQVNPTRMELTRIKRRLVTARRGHKLLKDKRDEMMRRFVAFIRRNQQLRMEVEESLAEALQGFTLARSVMPDEVLEQALMVPTRTMTLDVRKRNIMSVDTPVLEVKKSSEAATAYPYGFAFTSAELDGAIATLAELMPKLVELAQIEKTCNLLADEIEKTRRRVNALEHVMIPDLEATARQITMKLDENERASLTRLMKVKDMIAQRDM